MRPDRVEDWPTRTAHVPTLVDEFSQVSAALRPAPRVSLLNQGLPALIGEWIGLTAPIRRLMSQHVDEIADGRKSKTEQMRTLGGVDRFVNPTRPETLRVIKISLRGFRVAIRPRPSEIPFFLRHLSALISFVLPTAQRRRCRDEKSRRMTAGYRLSRKRD